MQPWSSLRLVGGEDSFPSTGFPREGVRDRDSRTSGLEARGRLAAGIWWGLKVRDTRVFELVPRPWSGWGTRGRGGGFDSLVVNQCYMLKGCLFFGAHLVVACSPHARMSMAPTTTHQTNQKVFFFHAR